MYFLRFRGAVACCSTPSTAGATLSYGNAVILVTHTEAPFTCIFFDSAVPLRAKGVVTLTRCIRTFAAERLRRNDPEEECGGCGVGSDASATTHRGEEVCSVETLQEES